MPILSDCLPTHVRWDVATRTIPPAHLARSFAAEVGQFYDRGEFDALARRVHTLYATHDPEQGGTFRARLDRRLQDRACAPVVWETAPDVRLPFCYRPQHLKEVPTHGQPMLPIRNVRPTYGSDVRQTEDMPPAVDAKSDL